MLRKFKKIKSTSLVLGVCVLAVSGSTFASVTPPVNCPPGVAKQNISKYWKGSQASMGFSNSTGNSTDTSLTSAMLVKFTNTNIANSLSGTAEYSSSDKGVTKEKYYIDNQFDYYFKDSMQQFLFLDNNATFDEFSPYYYTWVNSAGYGISPLNIGRFSWVLQAGPGWRQLQERLTKKTTNYFIFNTQSTMNYAIDKAGRNKLSEVLIYNVGQPFDYLSSNSSLVMQVLGHLSFVLSYQLEWVSKIPKGSANTKKLDTTTTANLVFTY